VTADVAFATGGSATTGPQTAHAATTPGTDLSNCATI
jgi:hypothetical protein